MSPRWKVWTRACSAMTARSSGWTSANSGIALMARMRSIGLAASSARGTFHLCRWRWPGLAADQAREDDVRVATELVDDRRERGPRAEPRRRSRRRSDGIERALRERHGHRARGGFEPFPERERVGQGQESVATGTREDVLDQLARSGPGLGDVRAQRGVDGGEVLPGLENLQ